ncbi:MAG: SH3 domain-containing protein [Eubacterium sp.]|nr:SH3 domain-containing protein [Eubacterium sp.]
MMKKQGDPMQTVKKNRPAKTGLLAVLALILILGTAVPAAATPFTSTDGVISINLPNGNWSEIEDPDHWISLSDGSSLITIQHFSNGDKLPEIPSADSSYARTLAAAISTENEVFVAFGYVADANETYDIYEALSSLRILQYDTKTAVARKVTASDFHVSPTEMTLYVNVSEEDGGSLNVRKGFSVNSEIVGKLENGTSVQVVGIVQLKGDDYGWYKISYGDGYGYVSADYLTGEAPAYTEEY